MPITSFQTIAEALGGIPVVTGLPSLVTVDLVVISSSLLTLIVIALVLAQMRISGGRVDSRGITPRLHPLQTFMIFEHLSLVIAPAITAALVLSLRAGEIGSGIWMFIAVVLPGALLAGDAYPLRLMTWARRSLHILVPAVGVSLFLLAALLGASPLFFESSIAALLAAFMVRSFGALIVKVLEARRPIRMAVIGFFELARRLDGELHECDAYRYKVVGSLSSTDTPETEVETDNLNYLGSLDQIRAVCEENKIDILVLDPEARYSSVLSEVAETLLGLEVRLTDLDTIHEQALGYVPMGMIDAAWFEHLVNMRFRFGLRPIYKRVIDLILGLVTTILVLPLIAVFAALIKIWDGGPAFYRQVRVGEKGREFEIVKLRTMRVDAEPAGQAVWASDADPRVTCIGRLLRKTHLDEVPQLFDVLTGRMTLVGPRPERPALAAVLEKQIPYYSRRHLVCPGITGWAQVRCGYANTIVDTAWKMGHDLYYLRKRSPVFDLLIMIETLRAVVLGSRYQLSTPEADHFWPLTFKTARSSDALAVRSERGS